MEKIGKSVLRRKFKAKYPPKLIALFRAVSLVPGEHFYPKKGKRLPKIYCGRTYIHVRLKDPKEYRNFKYHDVGREGYTMRLSAINKRTGKWETISWIFRRDKLMEDKKMQKVFFDIL